MRFRSIAIAILTGVFLVFAVAFSQDKKPLPRKDAFFGLHFDLHPNNTDVALGADVSEDNIFQAPRPR